MANGKHEENNPRRRPPRPPGLFVPLDSPIRKDEKEMLRLAGNPEVMSSKEQASSNTRWNKSSSSTNKIESIILFIC